jgi:hypothetical protein
MSCSYIIISIPVGRRNSSSKVVRSKRNGKNYSWDYAFSILFLERGEGI